MAKLSKEDFEKKFVRLESIPVFDLDKEIDEHDIKMVSAEFKGVWAYCEAYAEQKVDEERERKHREDFEDRFLGFLMVTIVSVGVSILTQLLF